MLSQANRSFDQTIFKAMNDVVIPDGLKIRLLGNLSRQQDQHYRRLLTRAGAFAAAAVLLLALGWYGVSRLLTPAPDMDEVRRVADLKAQHGEEDINVWLRDYYADGMVTHPDFDYSLMSTYQFASYQNKIQVPMILFLRADRDGIPYYAQMYLFDNRRFQLGDIDESKEFPSGLITKAQILTHPNPEYSHLRYLVIYTGSSLDPFLRIGRKHQLGG